MLSIKLADFGFASNDKSLTQIVGSALYMAPELHNKQAYDSKVDVWAAGVIGYTLLTGMVPYNGHDMKSLICSI